MNFGTTPLIFSFSDANFCCLSILQYFLTESHDYFGNTFKYILFTIPLFEFFEESVCLSDRFKVFADSSHLIFLFDDFYSFLTCLLDYVEKNVIYAFVVFVRVGRRECEYQKLRTNNCSWSIRRKSGFGFFAVNVRTGSILEDELCHLKTSNFEEKILWLVLEVIINTNMYFLEVLVIREKSPFSFMIFKKTT